MAVFGEGKNCAMMLTHRWILNKLLARDINTHQQFIRFSGNLNFLLDIEPCFIFLGQQHL